MPLFISRYHILWFSLFFFSALTIQNPTPFLTTYFFIGYILLYLFLLFPEFIVRDIFGKIWHPIDTFFLGLGLYFFFFTPLFYFTTKLSFTTLRIYDILLVFSLLVFCLYLKNLIIKTLPSKETPARPSFQKTDLFFIIFFVLYFLLHAFHFHFYQFLPEWDGYTDILTIENNLQDQVFHQDYRAFFQASASIMSTLLHLPPYSLFIYFFIPLQASIFLVFYRLFQIYQHHNLYHQSLVYFTALSIPVISMEIDMTRPQNILLIFIPLIFYLIILFEKEKHFISLLFLVTILVAGVKYHEFFWFFLLTLPLIFVPELLKQRALLKNVPFLIASTSTVLILLAVLFSVSQTLSHFALKVLLDIFDVHRWHLWFLDSYSNSSQENTQVGWNGILGATQYYGYYLSPILIALAGTTLLSVKKLFPRSLLFSKPILYSGFLLIVCFCFAEILPRLNSPFIPERYWIFFDITLIFFLLYTILHLPQEKSLFIKKPVFFFLILCCLIGLSASLYVASAKRSFITPDEYQTALWIQTHLPEDALVISQPANGPLIQNFGRRELYTPQTTFFMDESYHAPYTQKRQANLARIIQRLEENPNPNNTFTLSQLRKLLANQEALQKRPLYVLYSEQKFTNLYKSREWYQKQNFYGAHLEKFTPFEQVYQRNGITIWHIQ